MSKVTHHGLDDRGSILGGNRNFLYAITYAPSSGPTQPPILWVPEYQMVPEDGHSSPSSDEVKKSCSFTSTPSIRLQAVVRSHRGNFTYIFYMVWKI